MLFYDLGSYEKVITGLEPASIHLGSVGLHLGGNLGPFLCVNLRNERRQTKVMQGRGIAPVLGMRMERDAWMRDTANATRLHDNCALPL